MELSWLLSMCETLDWKLSAIENRLGIQACNPSTGGDGVWKQEDRKFKVTLSYIGISGQPGLQTLSPPCQKEICESGKSDRPLSSNSFTIRLHIVCILSQRS